MIEPATTTPEPESLYLDHDQWNEAGNDLCEERRRQRDEEDEARRAREEQLRKEHVREAMANVSLDLEESGDEDESEYDAAPDDQNPHTANVNQEEGKNPQLEEIVDTNHLKILYEARGLENDRLRAEIEKMETDHRQNSHDSALLRADTIKLQAQLRQAEDIARTTTEEAQQLRQELDIARGKNVDNEKQSQKLLSKLEEREHLLNTLQTQLHDLQSRDTVLKVREKHDELLRSVTEKHEHETAQLQQENDRLTQLAERARNESVLIISENERLKLQLRQAQEFTREREEQIREEEAQQFRFDLAKAEHIIKENVKENNELLARSKDADELAKKLQSELHATQREVVRATEMNSQLRDTIELQERSLAQTQQENERLTERAREAQVDLEAMKQKVEILQNHLHENRNLSDNFAQEQELIALRSEVKSKEKLLHEQEIKIKSLIVKWEEEQERIRINHCKERDSFAETRSKYIELKKWAKNYKAHAQEKLKKQLEMQSLEFEKTLLGYKQKMETAYTEKNQQIEEELNDIKHYYDQQIDQLKSLRQATTSNNRFLPPHEDFRSLPQICDSDEENIRPTTSSSNHRPVSAVELTARLCDDVVKEAKSQLKRPSFLVDKNVQCK